MRPEWGSGGSRSAWLPFSFYQIPVVRGLLVATVATFLLFFFAVAARPAITEWLAFSVAGRTGAWYLKPWTLVTYPLLEVQPLHLLIQGYGLFLVGGTLERSWGSRSFAVVALALTAVAALGMMVAAYLFQVPVVLAGWLLPLSALTVAWAAMDPEMELSFWGVLPLKLKFLALIFVLLVYFNFGYLYDPLVALFTLAGPAAAWFYIRKMPRLDFGTPRRPAPPKRSAPRRPLIRQEPEERVYRSGTRPSKREQEEIDRLRKLLGEDDDGRPATRH